MAYRSRTLSGDDTSPEPELTLFRTLAAERSIARISDAVAHAAMTVTHGKAGFLVIVDRYRGKYVVRGASGQARDKLDFEFDIRPQLGIVEWVRTNRQPVLDPDVLQADKQWSGWYRPVLGATRSELCVPIVPASEDRVIALLAVESPETDAFDSDSLVRLTSWSNPVAEALFAAASRETWRAATALVQQLGEAAPSPRPAADTFPRLLEFAAERTGARSASLRLVNEDGTGLRTTARLGETGLYSDEEIPVGSGIVGRVYLTGAFQMHSDVQSLPPGHYLCSRPNTRSELTVPIPGAGGVSVGVINLESEEIGNFDSNDAEIANLVASLAGIIFRQEQQAAALIREGQRQGAVDIARIIAHSVQSDLTAISQHLVNCITLLQRASGDGNDSTVADIVQRAHTLSLEGVEVFGRLFDALGFDLVEFNVADVVEEALIFARKYAPSNVKISLVDLHGAEYAVYADQQLARLSLDNIVKNAIDHLSSFSVLKEVTVGIVQDVNSVAVTVTDNGDGIPQNIASTLLKEPVSSRRTDTDTHHGLGLYLAATLSGMMGGSLTYESSPRAGTSFTLRLPAPAARRQP